MGLRVELPPGEERKDVVEFGLLALSFEQTFDPLLHLGLGLSHRGRETVAEADILPVTQGEQPHGD